MRPNQGRDREISRRETEMRAELIVDEMASAVRVLGGEAGSAKEQNTKAARAARLSVTIIERLRWKKVKRVPADIADAMREAVSKHNEESLKRAQHELLIERQRSAELRARLDRIDPDFARSYPGLDRRSDAGDRRHAD